MKIFCPNLFVDIFEYSDGKIEAMKIYKTEMDAFLFLWNENPMRALFAFRGSQSVFETAGVFELVYERK